MAGPTGAVTKRLSERSEGEHLDRDGVIYAEEIRYCWVDDDGARCSPVHGDFGKALSWVSDWPAVHARLKEGLEQAKQRAAEETAGNWAATQAEKAQEAVDRHSRTGLPPVSLRRLVIRTTSESIEGHEVVTVEHTLRASGLL